MCSGFACGLVTVVIGAALVVTSTIVSYVVVPNLVRNGILDEVVLLDDTLQMQRFEEIPFPLDFKVRIFNITNAQEVKNGAVPVLTELGPYVYKLFATRQIEERQEDMLRYRNLDHFEFDAAASFPYTEDDIVHVVNAAYHGVLQVAERRFPSLMTIMNEALPEIFGEYNDPISPVRVRDLLFDGMPFCKNPGFLGFYACLAIRQLSSNIQNMEPQPDGSINFSILNYRNGVPGGMMTVYRGINNPEDLGRINSWEGSPSLSYWQGSSSVCNMVNGTDSGVFNPFVNTEHPLYALNSDICRSVELRYQNDVQYKNIPALRFAANEWFLDNTDGCFCLNVTTGINREDGCLLRGAMELFTCVGAYMVLSYPHFLFADIRYRNGVVGMAPVTDEHRIFVDIEPNTGTVVRGAKRAQFNVFMRPVTNIVVTQNWRTTLTPLLWVEEGMSLPEQYTEELTTKLLSTLELVNLLIPIAVAACCAVLLVGILIAVCFRFRQPTTKDDVLTNNSSQ